MLSRGEIRRDARHLVAKIVFNLTFGGKPLSGYQCFCLKQGTEKHFPFMRLSMFVKVDMRAYLAPRQFNRFSQTIIDLFTMSHRVFGGTDDSPDRSNQFPIHASPYR
jgi:hypothetical protein